MKIVEFPSRQPRTVDLVAEHDRFRLRIKALLSSARRRKLKDEEVDELEAYLGLDEPWDGLKGA